MFTCEHVIDFIDANRDNPPHVYNKSLNDLVSTELIKELTRNITDLLDETFPDMLVLPMIGNHDYYPKNQLPGENNELYDAYTDMWSHWLEEPTAIETFRRGDAISTNVCFSRIFSELHNV